MKHFVFLLKSRSVLVDRCFRGQNMSVYSEFKEFIILKKLKQLLNEWWNLDVFLIEAQNKTWLYDEDTKIHNPIVAHLLKNSLMKEDFLACIAETIQGQEIKNESQQALWKKSGLELYITPLVFKNKVRGFLVATGFKPENLKRLKEALLYVEVTPSEIEKELKNLKELEEKDIFCIQKLLSILAEESFLLFKEKLSQEQNFYSKACSQLIGASPSMKYITSLIEQIKTSEKNVFIHGEPGSGKTFLAQQIHENSPRKQAPFVVLDCSQFNEEAISHKLFGLETNGNINEGVLSQANKGTLLLKHIENLPKNIQTRLNRSISESCFFPVKSKTKYRMDVRILASTNLSLDDFFENKILDEKLFFNLNIININNPNLRERIEDIPLLVQHFVRKNNPTNRKKFSKTTMEIFASYSWPENLKELEKEVNQILSQSHSSEFIVTEKYISQKIKRDSQFLNLNKFEGQSLKDILLKVEEDIITEELKKEKGNKSKVAQKLGLSRTSIMAKVKKYESSKESA